ncbi:MAG TPA: 3'-5' exonuclease, partial [Bdellovibrionota bacterium]|nr:3'-5' exonuclease [Bdellovibrionota bacterium]
GPGSSLTEVIVEDDHGEGQYVADEIGRRNKELGTPFQDFAVLYRSNAQSRIFEETLRREQIPYKIVGGMSFLDRKEVKDVLCYWRLAVNPRDDASLRRVIGWPSRGIGKTAIETLGTAAFQANQAIYDTLEKAPELAPRAATGAESFRSLIATMRAELEGATSPELLANWGRRSLDQIGVKKALEEEEKEDPVQLQRRWESVEELCHSLGQMPAGEFSGGGVAALREFLARMTLESQDEKNEETENQNQVTLLTLHGAKGLEFPVVFLVGLEDGILPHKRTIEDAGADLGEERRLCYVGITRAKDHLMLCRARHRVRYGKPVPRVRSRFLEEIPKDLLVTEDRSNGPTKDDPADRKKAHEEKVKDYLAGIRGMLGGNSPR